MSAAKLLDTLKSEFKIKNDAALSRELEVTPAQISKLRAGTMALGPAMILSIHEHLGVPVHDIRTLASDETASHE